MSKELLFHKLMLKRILSVGAVLLGISVIAGEVCAQGGGQPVPQQPVVKLNTGNDKRDGDNVTVSEMLTKQQVTRRKKEYDEMLKRGDEALRLSEELESSFESKENIDSGDIQKLQELEKVVSKIRGDLGGDDDDEISDPNISENSSENAARKDVVSAIKYLRNSTVKLVDELKRSTRFSISVTAIQTSNAVIRFAKFLRLKK